MHATTKRLLPTVLLLEIALAATGAAAQMPPAASATPARAATAAGAAPAPSPSGEKTKPGCCCYPNDQVPGGWACTWGWQKSRCASVAADLKKVGAADGRFKWNEGRCPSPAAAQ